MNWKKGFFILSGLFFVCLFTTLAYGSVAEPSYAKNTVGNESGLSDESTQEHVLMDMQINGDGYYSFFADVDVQAGEYGLETISIHDPILLAFSVSSAHQGGVWVLDLDEGEEIISVLEEAQAVLFHNGNTSEAEKISTVIEQLETTGPITGAST